MNITEEQAKWVLILHDRWRSMRRRCKPGSSKAKYWGDRGIRVCKEWDDNFLVFFHWSMGSGFHPDLTLERLDGDKNYYPDNCMWATWEDQNRNKKTLVLNEDKVSEIKWLLEQKKSHTAIGLHYGVSRFCINQISYNANWKSVIPKRPKNYLQLLNLPDYNKHGPIKKKRSNSSSKFHGVYLRKGSNKWTAYIAVGGKSMYIGCFVCEEEAARAYDKKAIECFGNDATLNSPD